MLRLRYYIMYMRALYSDNTISPLFDNPATRLVRRMTRVGRATESVWEECLWTSRNASRGNGEGRGVKMEGEVNDGLWGPCCGKGAGWNGVYGEGGAVEIANGRGGGAVTRR